MKARIFPCFARAWLVPLFVILSSLSAQGAPREDAQWIWSPAHARGKVPAATCYFRKTFSSGAIEQAHVEITADDAYELYVNGRRVGAGHDWRQLDKYDISGLLVRGDNAIAVKAVNEEPGPAGIVARVIVKQQDGTHIAYSSNGSWKSSIREDLQWTKVAFDDGKWEAARSLGTLGVAQPWGNETQVAGGQGRFRVMSGFRVEWVVSPMDTGSLIAMTFDEFGQILASQEGGPLLLIADTDENGVHDTVSVYCEKIKNCQGLLALNGSVFAVGDGPDGAALYRLVDADLDGKIDDVRTLVKFKGEMGEHGPHAVTLGPDGLLYVVIGNHTSFDGKYSETSPLRDVYEGDLVQPRFEDPRGHARGVKAPGGAILRTDVDGSFVELVAGGLRNAYDLAFNRQGDLFTYDSDMEHDEGFPWYRPTRVFHVTPGAEFGWRTGWAKWPAYYLDALPPVHAMGPGSPAGVVFYDHFMFPKRFHNAMFACDWSLGKINVLRMEQSGGSYAAKTEVLLEGRPLNVTDLAVGPNGWLYFTTGGRGTEGGIYCITWLGQVPPEERDMGRGIERAIRQPQLHSAWGRQRIAEIRKTMGDRWGVELVEIVRDSRLGARIRTRAIDLMQLFGPAPTIPLLTDLAADPVAEIRAKAAFAMGIYFDEISAGRLEALLSDKSAIVRRQACESLLRSGAGVSADQVIPLLADSDRRVAFAARRVLERTEPALWNGVVMTDERSRVFLQGATALLVSHPDRKTADAILDRCRRMIGGEVNDPKYPPGFISDEDFTDLIRVVQLALMRGQVESDHVSQLSAAIALEYPAGDAAINRELVRVLAYLGESSVNERIMARLASDAPPLEKLHLAAHAPFFRDWTAEQKMTWLEYFERARTANGDVFAGYIDNISRQFFKGLSGDERQRVLNQGARWPSSALSVLAGLPEDANPETMAAIIALDRELSGAEGSAVHDLRTGIVAVLGRNKTPAAMAHLRELFEKEPERRAIIAVGLAQEPGGENWPLLVRSLPVVDGRHARLVLTKLATVDRRPESPEAIRQAVLCGLRLKEDGGLDAVALLKTWTGGNPSGPDDGWEIALTAWQKWFAEQYADLPPAELPAESDDAKWGFDELLTFLSSPAGSKGSSGKGAVVFERAQCVKCHRFGSRGESIGPDLTNVSRRFQKKEILESVLFPSHVVSDQYRSQVLVTADGRTLSGMVADRGPDEVVVLQSSGEKVTLKRSEIDEISPSKISSMPAGLLNQLTLDDVADLFAYLYGQPRENITSRRDEIQR